MATTTPNFGWSVPTSTDLVKDGATAIETLGDAIDASLVDLKGGTTGQILSKNSNTDMDFTWAAPASGDITGVTAGTGISGGGTSGDVTITNSMATAITTNGDLIYGTGSGTFTRRGIGSTNQVLTVSGGVPTWATPSSGGMTVLATGTLSGASITISSIDQGYKNLQLVLEKCLPAGASEGPIIRFNGDTGTNYYRTTSTVINLQTWNETQLRLGGIQDNGTSQSLAVCDILDYANTTTWKMARNMTIQNRNGTPTSFDINNTQALFWYASNGASAITSIEIKTDTSAGFTSGTYILYGVK